MSDGIDPQMFEAMRRKLETLRQDVWNLQDENDRLRQEVDDLRLIVGTDTDAHSYEQMTREQKVFKLRRKLATCALNTDGTDRMEYADVQKVFDKHPSPGHTYDLMALAGEKDGYTYGEAPDGTKRITVNLSAVNDSAIVRAAKNGNNETPA